MSRRRGAATAGLAELPLPALLSAALVAFVIECDSEIEVELGTVGPGPIPSLVVWLNLLQYLRDRPASVRELSDRSHTTIDQVRFVVGKLEHWGVLVVSSGSTPARSAERARAHQAMSSVKPSSQVCIAETAAPVVEAWPAVIDEVQSRWQRRHGAALQAALDAASALADQPAVSMPAIVPTASGNRVGRRDWKDLPAGKLEEPRLGRVPTVLSRALLATKIAYEELSPVPLVLAANTLRVIGEDGTAVAQIHTRTGNPPETAASHCTHLTRGLGLAELAKGAGQRVKLIRLTAAGRQAQAAHTQVIEEVEAALDPRGETAGALRRLLDARHGGDLALRRALTPPRGTRRFSTEWVTGRPVDDRDRQIVAQTEAFRSDPFASLPHYPVWEATRGFRP